MGPDLDFEKELELELARQEEIVKKAGIRMTRISMPPPPPAKESPKRPPPLASTLDTTSRPSSPPNRPLPPRPMSKQPGLSRSTTSASTWTAPSLPPPSIPPPSLPPPTRPPPLRPQAPLTMNPPTRPGTSGTQKTGTTASFPGSTKRMSWTSTVANRRIKYGQGKFGNIELVPQPSDDPDDPLNWPTWRKELNFYSLMLFVAMTGVLKTILMTVNAQLAESYEVSYTAVAALTGVPLILSSFTGLFCLVASRICGKRPLYLASGLLVFIGTVWNTNVATSYAQHMAARVFQGLGWGAFETLVLGSIQDTYFEHERNLRIAIHSTVAISTTWGAPLLGGVASQGNMGFSLQFAILSVFFILAIPAITLGVPETAFDRTLALAQTPATASSNKYSLGKSLPLAPRSIFSLEFLADYIVKLKPYSYSPPPSSSFSKSTLLQAPLAFIAPTTLLLFLVSALPHAILWGFSSSLSLLFHPLPFVLNPSSIGALLLTPFLLSTTAVAAFSLVPQWRSRFSPKLHMAAIAFGSVLAFIGILTFGLHIDNCMSRAQDDLEAEATSVYALEYLGAKVNLPAVSFVLGLLAAGVYVIDGTVRPLVRVSTAFTSSNLGVAMRNTGDMTAGVGCWRGLIAGICVIAVPNAAWAWDGLRRLCIGFGIAQMVVAAVVGSVWWLWGEEIRRWDGRVMRLVDLEMLKRTGSFFDAD
ncbi:major facilitator superfamily domain-containing protein [Cladorrhinum sp. PSN332]|nr:major facilitator superfamily domain-containing protein [Cladorrhinum sp. PSN332]